MRPSTLLTLVALLIFAGPAWGGWRIVAQPTSPLHTPRARHEAVALPDGKVFVSGGFEVRVFPLPGVKVLASCEIFDPSGATWAEVPAAMLHPRWDHAASALPDGRVLLAGGKITFDARSKSGTLTRTTELYDPAKGAFALGPEMDVARADFTATPLGDGRVLLAGGRTAQVFDPGTNTFRATIPLRVARSAHRAVALGGGKVLLVGGESRSAGGSAEVVDTAGGVSRMLAAKLVPPVNDHSAALLPDGKVLIAAGQRSDGGLTIGTMRVLDLGGGDDVSLVRTLGEDLPNRGGISDMACFAFGPLVLLCGGEADNNREDRIVTQAWLFDAASGRFVAQTTMATPHDDFAAAELPPTPQGRKRVLLVAGLRPDPALGECTQANCEILTIEPAEAPATTQAAEGGGRGN